MDTADDLSAEIAAAQNGEPWAFGALFERFQPAVLRYLAVRVRGEEEDLASEVWIDAARNIQRFKGNGDDFRKWLFTIAFRRAADARRKITRRKTDAAETSQLESHLPTSAGVDTDTLTALATEKALALLQQLPEQQAEIITLRIVAGLDTKEVAKITGKKEGAVRIAQMRGLQRLQELLTEGNVTI